MTRQEYEQQVQAALDYMDKAGIALTEEERRSMEVADFGMNDVRNLGLQLIVYINTDRVCAKEMVLLPGQTCPEHKHVPSYSMPGKEETFRCRMGEVYLYVEGAGSAEEIRAQMPRSKVTVFHEVILHPGEQYTIYPGTLHWFQGGPEGAVVSEFSTRSTDETDMFTDERIIRQPVIE